MSSVLVKERPAAGYAWLTCAGLVALTLAIRLVPAWLLQAEVADVAGYRTSAEAALRGDDVYAPGNLFPYTPYPQFVHVWALLLANATGWRFDFTTKLPLILADGAVTAIIFRYIWDRMVPWRGVILWTLFWALNPVGILISAFHGSLHSLVPPLVIAAFITASQANESSNRRLLLAVSALSIGVAAALRTFPALLVPIFLALTTRSVKEAVTYLALAALPSTLSTLPYLIFARETFLRENLGYGGVVDFGWVSIIRTIPYFVRGDKPAWPNFPLVQSSKLLFLYAYAAMLLALPFFRRSSLGRALQLPPLLFYALYGGVSAQYLVWVVPLGILLRDRMVLPFTAIATTAIVGFYAMYHPGILSGRYPPLIPESPAVMAVYAAANVVLVVFSFVWALWIIGTDVREYRRTWKVGSVQWMPHFTVLRRSRAYLVVIGAVLLAWAVDLARITDEAREVFNAISR